MTKRLYRSDDNKIAAGVLGGVAEYYEIDPVIVRIIAVFVAVLTGVIPFALVYLLSVLVVPKRVHIIEK
ncbi:MAG: PspC domain-containing protein [Candidatus Pacebacteria bacterium]|nr:PspC domain-containing protein [Candidatus Paceibacterota bacterium]